jgi:two-component system nitrogen regulation sensor histidine kinase GlnL
MSGPAAVTPFPSGADAPELLDALAVGVLVLDADLGVQYANVAAQVLLGFSLGPARGGNFATMLAGSPELTALLQRALADGKSCAAHELELATTAALPAAGPVIVDVTVTPLEERSGGARLLLELADARARARLARETEQRTSVDGGRLMIRQLAHEIKNPLGGLRGAAQLLERELPDPALREYTAVIINEADRLCGLVDAMVGPASPPRKQLLSIHEVCEHVYQLLRSEAPPGVRIERDYDPSVPEGRFDRNEMIQALLNIARNALQALSGSGRLVLRTRALSNHHIGSRRHRLLACVQVEDDGPGVPEELRRTLFLPLVTSRAAGSGLGLSVAQDMVRRHRGTLEFESRPGHTVFSMLLPLEDAA